VFAWKVFADSNEAVHPVWNIEASITTPGTGCLPDGRFTSAALPELVQIFGVARRAMRDVLPLRIFFDAVIELHRPPSKFGNRLAIQTAPPLGV
jgi:hypothetical protein